MQYHPNAFADSYKLFAPTFTPPKPSLSRLHIAETIIRANTDLSRMHMASTFNRAGLLQLLASHGVRVGQTGLGEEVEEGDLPGCQTQ
jgi:hypothetical protein